MSPGAFPKLSDFVELAAAEYYLESGRVELDARWIAAYFQDSGVMDAYPRQDPVAFGELVQKALDTHAERAGKQMRLHLARIARVKGRLRRR
ncbi:hypothetical protein [Thauera phenolivorans]|uniref:hypothetical protein n=1 Tax=Thauera phenolivorans TaxID=1792543 RepID=UPI00083A8085|nr:hypothetical protein [Thauera phenolivorans]